MREYWLRIALGALAIFAVGMIGISLVRRGVSEVKEVAGGTGPITLPVAFVPFSLDGRRLGTLHKVVLHRDAPRQLSSVELEVRLSDSVLARGLEGCRLIANFDDTDEPGGLRPLSSGMFSCLQGDDSLPRFQDFGRAVFQPGNVSVPLFLPNDIVDDLRHGEFDPDGQDSVDGPAQATIDSITEAVEARADSLESQAEAQADSVLKRNERLVDSLRREGARRVDSTRRSTARMADSARQR